MHPGGKLLRYRDKLLKLRVLFVCTQCAMAQMPSMRLA